jgi:hypothetical protein
MARRAEPALSRKELKAGRYDQRPFSEPPVSKSAVRHRFERVESADGLRVGNPRYSRLGSLRYEFLPFSAPRRFLAGDSAPALAAGACGRKRRRRCALPAQSMTRTGLSDAAELRGASWIEALAEGMAATPVCRYGAPDPRSSILVFMGFYRASEFCLTLAVEFSMSLPLKSAAAFWNVSESRHEPVAATPHEEENRRRPRL